MAGETRDRILDAAEALFLARGVGNVTVVDIERASGLAAGSGAFYRHFEDKAAAYVEVIRREADRALADLTDGTGTGTGIHSGTDAGRSGHAHELAVRMEHAQRMRRLFLYMMRDDGQHPEARHAIAEALLQLGRAAAFEVGTRDRPDALATEMVVTLAQIGYVLALEFFGDLPFGVSPERFLAALADLVDPAGPVSD